MREEFSQKHNEQYTKIADEIKKLAEELKNNDKLEKDVRALEDKFNKKLMES